VSDPCSDWSHLARLRRRLSEPLHVFERDDRTLGGSRRHPAAAWRLRYFLRVVIGFDQALLGLWAVCLLISAAGVLTLYLTFRKPQQPPG